jgi:ABC-2 type transport system permease protein
MSANAAADALPAAAAGYGALPVDDRTNLISPEREARAFWRARLATVRNAVVRSREASRFRIAMVGLLAATLWGILYVLFVDGFRFLRSTIADPATQDEAIRGIYSLFFASLLLLLMFSAGLILYGLLYRSAETRFLLTTPARPERIYLHKFQESMFFSSWVFLLLATPMLVAHGRVEGANWYFFALLVPSLLAFAAIPGSLGAIACMLVVRYLPSNRKHLLVLVLLVSAVAVGSLAWSFAHRIEGNLLTPAWFQNVLARLRLTEYRLLPSWWLSSALLEAVHSGWNNAAGNQAFSESMLFLTLLVANALFFNLLAVWTAQRIFRPGFLALEGERTSRRSLELAAVDQLLLRSAGFLPPHMRLLMVKDLRLFRRDPLQWSQSLIFFALLLFYFFNTRKLSHNPAYIGWINMISFLNLAIIGLMLSTFTTRFVFPMISLEGRRFWILGLLPVEREAILRSKFLFATLGSIGPCCLLVVASDVLLGVSRPILLVHLLLCMALCSGLSGIAVGLGAMLPNMRQPSPSRIAAGFGGTLTLVLSTAFIALTVLSTAVPCHFYLAMLDSPTLQRAMDPEPLEYGLALGMIGSVLSGILATVVPLWLGAKAFRRLEF